ncbi:MULTISPECIES: dihydrofolate reductase family protein [unclassified Paenibacillus]|uniref:dihydrofolate reductase family protein n=1 Tax=unclassified Paenibacillus TaxID=185978 RepID=UPI000838D30B|nr:MULTISPECIES: dihydrofolate reductase family protein [unclassified Paenibacillus]NWL88043.1 dihydrofolate reductase [Paenibacillus sp. 79R4]
MGKIIMQQFVSLDGVMQAPGDPNEYEYGGWQMPYVGEEHLERIVEQAHAVEALLLGRKTYEGFAASWPLATGMRGLAERMNQMAKFVMSRSLSQAEWNTSILLGEAAEEAVKLKQQLSGDLLVVGSGDLAQTLMKHQLIDEYRLWVHPVILGDGQRLFREGNERASMRLIEVKTLKSGVVISTYEPEK